MVLFQVPIPGLTSTKIVANIPCPFYGTYKVTFLNVNGKKQTEVMKGSTLNERRSSGLSIQNIQPYQAPATNQSQDNAAKVIGAKGK